MEINQSKWGLVDGIEVYLISIKDPETGFSVKISNYGATLVSVEVPDKNGEVGEVTVSQNRPEDFKANPAYLGAVVGRVANRIKNGKFTLEGKDYQLFQNNNGNSLHGGKVGFNNKIWTLLESSTNNDDARIKFEYLSPDGEENYPGTLKVHTTYNISPMKIGWEFQATTDKTTIINLTNHAYWNLESLDVVNDYHHVTLFCDRYMIADEGDMVTGEVADIEKMGFDLRKGITLSEVYNSYGDVDNNFFVESYDSENPLVFHKCAELYSEKSGRRMIVETTEPCVHLYTGNYMEGILSCGKEQKKHNALCFETQRPPNAINFPEFKSMFILKPGETYTHKTQHTFIIEKNKEW